MAPPATASPATAGGTSNVLHVDVGSATPLTRSDSLRGGEVSSATTVAAATLTDSGARSVSAQPASGFSVLPVLIIAVLALMLGYAGIRLRRHRQRRQMEDFWHHQDADWEATVHQLETEQTLGGWKPSAEQLQKVDAA